LINKNGFIIDYKGIKIYLPKSHLLDSEIKLGQSLNIFIQKFSHTNHIIATQKDNSKIDTVNEFKKYFDSQESIEFEIISFDDAGILVSKDENVGFIPNSHIFPLNKDKILEGEKIKLKIISISISKGLVLSARNHYLFDTLQKIREAFLNQLELKGVIKTLNSSFFSVFYEGIELKMNNEFIAPNEIKLEKEVKFKIIDFSLNKDISISNFETLDCGILQQYLTKNQFIGEVHTMYEEGAVIVLNEMYKSGFMHLKEISNELPWNFDYSKIKKGAKIKVSIKQFDYRGLLLSRSLYKKKERWANASSVNKISQILEMKIKDLYLYGALVRNESINGIITIENILPKEIISQIDKLDFIKYCKDVFRRRAIISCIITDIDKHTNRISLDLNYSQPENIERMKQIILYFNNNENLKVITEDFYANKVKISLK
jgi:ribosomal protein S1